MKNGKRQAGAGESWIPTSCTGCFNACAILARRSDGKIVDIKGDRRAPSSKGKICGKSKARIADMYNPKRLTRPLRRTNPEKGLGVDPMWEEIGWEEAIDVVTSKLAQVRNEDPRKLVVASFDIHNYTAPQSFGVAFGTPNYEFYPVSCGNGLHTAFFLTLGALNAEIDLDLCNYILLSGSQYGHGVNNNTLEAIQGMADARRRGAKLVVIDPVCSYAAAKADEWVPIRPGTDGALALGMVNVLINDLGLFDREFLKGKTNAPYLIDGSGKYVRHPDTGKPLVWDEPGGRAVDFDTDRCDPAIDGNYEVAGIACRPAFRLLREHIREHYPLGKVEAITTVPRATIARITKELAEAARIGSTIEMEGKTLPLRPAAVEFKRGITHHKNGFFNCFSLMLLNTMLGNLNVPGGILGTNPHGPFGIWRTHADKDGLITTNLYQATSGGRDSMVAFMSPYPPSPVSEPKSLNLRDLFPVSGFLPGSAAFAIHDPEKFHIPYTPEAMILCRTNMVLTSNSPQFQAEMLGKLKFIVAFALKVDETVEFADIVIPDAHDFEKYWAFPANLPAGFQKPGLGDWYFQTVQPVVEPPPGVRNWIEVLMDIADRLGILGEFNAEMNRMTGLVLNDALALKPDVKYSMKEIRDRTVLLVGAMCGQAPAAAQFTEERTFLQGPKKTIEESSPGAFYNARAPIYLEHLIEVGEEVRKVTRRLGMDWWDISHYNPLAEWRPCPVHEEDGKEYDLFVVNSRLPLHGQSYTADNPWVDDICKRTRMDYNVALNRDTAFRKGIKDGDLVRIESRAGKVFGRVRLTEGIHPECLGIFGVLGQWAKDKVIARGKGTHINSLLNHDWSMVGTLTGQLDFCARVKVSRDTGN